jgi:hypothetical protein
VRCGEKNFAMIVLCVARDGDVSRINPLKAHYRTQMPALLAFILLLSGCAGTKTVSYQQLRSASLHHFDTFYPDTTYYCGTEEGYDYFYIEYGQDQWNEGRKYRILSSESPIQKRIERTKDRDEWVKVTLQQR